MEKRAQSKRDELSIQKNKENISTIWTILMYGDAVDKWLMFFGFLGALGDGMSLPAMFLVTSKTMNNLGIHEASSISEFTNKINLNALNMLYVALGRWVFSFLEGYCWTRTGERQASALRTRYLKAVLRQEIEYFELNKTLISDVITSVSSDSLIIQDVVSEKIPNFIMNLATFCSCYVVGFLLAGRLALVALPTVILLVIPGLMYGRMLTSLSRKIREEYNEASTIVEQAISSVRTVYSFVGETKTMTEFSAALRRSVKLGLRQGLLKGIAVSSQGITFAIWAFMTWYASHSVVYYGGKGGNIFSFGASIILGGLSLGSALSNVKYISEASSSGERMIAVMGRVPKFDSESTEGDIVENISGEVEFKGVGFAYPLQPDNPVLRDFNLRVPRGNTLALVGDSGSGKSTVIALMERFYDPDVGEILFDGVDIKKLQLKWLRSQMGLVSQEPTLFATSIKENILFGKEDASMDEVVEAAKASNAHKFISQLPLGYETQVGERGVQMSGGQKQRIALACALIRSPKILLLDETTSALDSESESIVQEALQQASIGRTTVVIAHRLSTIRNSNIIAVVKAGHIVEIGSHDDLVCDEEGIYSSLVHMQQTTRAREERGDSGSIIHDRTSKKVRHTLSISKSAARDTSESREPKMDINVPSFWRLLMLNASEWKQALLGCLSSVVFGGIQPVYALVNGNLISVYFEQDDNEVKNKTRIYCIIFTSLSILSLVNISQHYYFGAMGEYLTKRVREKMLSKMLSFELGWFDQDENSTGAICSRLANDANVVRSLVGDRMALVIHTLSAVTIAWTMGLLIAWRLAVVMIVIQPLCMVCHYTRKVLLKNMSSRAIEAQAESSTLAAEAVSNIRVITAFSSQDRVLHLFSLAQEGPHRETIRQAWYAGIGLATSQCLITCSWAFNFWYGGKLISQGYISSKAFFQTVLIITTTGRVIAEAGSMTTDLAKGSDAVASVFAVIDRVTRIDPEDPNGHCPDMLEGCIKIRDVDFAYPARPDFMIFRGFSLSIDAGKSTALVGKSGSGKSTIIGLIERFYDPLCGTIDIDGRDIRSYHLRFLRQQIALVSQEPTLFSVTIRENIAYGTEGATEAEIEAAARSANAHDFISTLKDGYDTRCGAHGAQLSGGQKQRVAIARAILKDPAILLLDEATSALDSRSERLVQAALGRVLVGRTSVVVAHRLGTIQNCDLIVVLENGEVAEKGTHSSLLAVGPGGSYYGMVRLQQGDEEN